MTRTAKIALGALSARAGVHGSLSADLHGGADLVLPPAPRPHPVGQLFLRLVCRSVRNQQIIDALANTLIVGFFAVLIALVIATLLAFHVHRHPGRTSAGLQFVIFPAVPPSADHHRPLAPGYFREIGFPRGLIAVIVGHSIFVLALVYRTILNRLQTLSRSLIEASQDLGATRWQTFRYVLFPHLRMAVVTAALLAFALSFDETIITLFLVGDTSTLPIRLYAMMRVGFTPEINALVTLILLFSAGLTLIIARFVGGSGGQLDLK